MEIGMPKNLIIVAVTCIGLCSCTWVKLTEDGAQVRVLKTQPDNCRNLGRTTSVSRAEVARIQRNEDKVALELETLARNHAVGMGGDTIVIEGGVTGNAERTFGVFDCSQ
jgi:hypothetical protein